MLLGKGRVEKSGKEAWRRNYGSVCWNWCGAEQVAGQGEVRRWGRGS